MRLVSTHAAETALRTSMIGWLDRIERKLGHLWGHDKNEDELTDEDEDMYEIYMELREEILDYGNEQICRLKGTQWKKKQ